MYSSRENEASSAGWSGRICSKSGAYSRTGESNESKEDDQTFETYVSLYSIWLPGFFCMQIYDQDT